MTTERKQSIERFVAARVNAARIMREASKLPGLPDLYKAQANTISGLSALSLSRIVGQADHNDLLALRDDLEAIASQVDPLILMIGDEAASAVHGVDLTLFEDQLIQALAGNATHELTEASERIEAAYLEAAE